jgi:hypothetical protein
MTRFWISAPWTMPTWGFGRRRWSRPARYVVPASPSRRHSVGWVEIVPNRIQPHPCPPCQQTSQVTGKRIEQTFTRPSIRQPSRVQTGSETSIAARSSGGPVALPITAWATRMTSVIVVEAGLGGHGGGDGSAMAGVPGGGERCPARSRTCWPRGRWVSLATGGRSRQARAAIPARNRRPARDWTGSRISL